MNKQIFADLLMIYLTGSVQYKYSDLKNIDGHHTSELFENYYERIWLAENKSIWLQIEEYFEQFYAGLNIKHRRELFDFFTSSNENALYDFEEFNSEKDKPLEKMYSFFIFNTRSFFDEFQPAEREEINVKLTRKAIKNTLRKIENPMDLDEIYSISVREFYDEFYGDSENSK